MLQSLICLLPLGVLAAPPAAPTGAQATQTVQVTAAAPSSQNGLQVVAPSANVMANNVKVDPTVYPIDLNEWDKAWAANANSPLLTAPNGVVDTSVSVDQGVNDLFDSFPSGNSTGGYPDCQFRFPGDPGYDANDKCATSGTFPDSLSNSTDPNMSSLGPKLTNDLSSNSTNGNLSLTAGGMYPDCDGRYPEDRGYDAYDECARTGDQPSGSGGGYPDCQGNYPGDPGYDKWDDCAQGGSGGGGQRSTRYHLEFNIGGRSAIQVSRVIYFLEVVSRHYTHSTSPSLPSFLTPFPFAPPMILTNTNLARYRW